MTVLLRMPHRIWLPLRYKASAEEDNPRWWCAGDSERETFGPLLYPGAFLAGVMLGGFIQNNRGRSNLQLLLLCCKRFVFFPSARKCVKQSTFFLSLGCTYVCINLIFQVTICKQFSGIIIENYILFCL